VSRIALDIGGSLCKIVHFERAEDGADGLPGGRLHFLRVPTHDADAWMRVLRALVDRRRAQGHAVVRGHASTVRGGEVHPPC
jgi:pantothenate kinase